MELHIIRHGQTVGNLSGILQGWSDSSLLPEQSRSLKAINFDASVYDVIYSSDAGRCTETCNALRLPDLIVDQRLRERNFGAFENRSHTFLKEYFTREYERFHHLGADYRPPEGESRIQHFNRLSSWIQSIQRCNTVLAVSHGGMLDFLYRLSCGLDLHGGERIFDGANAAMSKFRINWPQVELITFGKPLDT